MTDAAAETLSVVVERTFAHPPERIWRALTEPHLVSEWLMKNDFKAETGHSFSLEADWGRVDCKVLALEPNRRISYAWDTKDLRSTVTFTLTPSSDGTLLRMEQEGFQQHQQPYYRGASVAWPKFIDALERVVEEEAGKGEAA